MTTYVQVVHCSGFCIKFRVESDVDLYMSLRCVARVGTHLLSARHMVSVCVQDYLLRQIFVIQFLRTVFHNLIFSFSFFLFQNISIFYQPFNKRFSTKIKYKMFPKRETAVAWTTVEKLFHPFTLFTGFSRHHYFIFTFYVLTSKRIYHIFYVLKCAMQLM